MKFTEIIKNIESDLTKIKNPLWRYIISYFFFAFISLYEIFMSLYKTIERLTERFFDVK